jgi:hypothetical protein
MVLMIILALVSVSAVAAEDNATDVVSEISEEVISEEIPVEEPSGDSVLSQSAEDSLSDDNQTALPAPATSRITTSSAVKGYETFTTTLSFKLTADEKPLAFKPVSVIINGVTYAKTTDSNGEGSVDVDLKAGTYTAEFRYAGDNSTTDASATSTVTVSEPVKTSMKVGDKDINYRQGSKCLFYVKLVDANGKAIKNQMVRFVVDGKTYTAKTNSKGEAKIYLNLKKGKHKIKYYFDRTAPYLSSSGSFTVKVKSKMAKGNGYWVWSSHMKKVNLKSLAKKGTKHIFLHVQAIAVHGKAAVVSFIKKAHKYKMKVHLWMQVCCIGDKWTRPVNKDGSLKYGFMNKKIREAKRYAKIKGVDGIHFDYVRFGGTAHLYKTSTKAINYFVKKASLAVHKIRPNCIVSGALMPEPSAMKYYYGQDVPTMSRYMDVLLPMVYKGNYHQTRKWITSVTKTFVKQSSGAQIWTGLQSYHSDNNAKKLSQKTLLKDAKAAKAGGAKGIVLFRYGISCNFNFKKV